MQFNRCGLDLLRRGPRPWQSGGSGRFKCLDMQGTLVILWARFEASFDGWSLDVRSLPLAQLLV
jgi:hypothetical protein